MGKTVGPVSGARSMGAGSSGTGFQHMLLQWTQRSCINALLRLAVLLAQALHAVYMVSFSLETARGPCF
jgi:hypothetical protein